MSELKAYNVVATADVNPEVADYLGCTEWAAYDKSEADKVIAEKDKKIADLIEKNKRLARKDLIMASETINDLEESHKKEVGQLLMKIAELKKTLNNSRNARKYWRKEYLIEYKECCSQKYKRCLAMVETCIYKKELDEDRYHMHGGHGWTNYRFWDKWQKTWLELSEKFKDKESK